MIESENRIPYALDLFVSNDCQMNCACFAPEKDEYPQTISIDEWKNIILKGNESGIKKIVFTGFEPLLSKDFPELACFAKNLNMETTLSTNTLLFPIKHKEFIKWIDNIGVPIDGSTPEINARTRHPLGYFQYQTAIESLTILQNEYPNKCVTIRTIISRNNIDDICNIPIEISKRGVDISKIRWKVYQYNPAVPECHKDEANKMSISTAEFLKVVNEIRINSGFGNVAFMQNATNESNHLLIYPNGDGMILKRDKQAQKKFDILPRLKYQPIGSTISNFEEVINNWKKSTK